MFWFLVRSALVIRRSIFIFKTVTSDDDPWITDDKFTHLQTESFTEGCEVITFEYFIHLVLFNSVYVLIRKCINVFFWTFNSQILDNIDLTCNARLNETESCGSLHDAMMTCGRDNTLVRWSATCSHVVHLVWITILLLIPQGFTQSLEKCSFCLCWLIVNCLCRDLVNLNLNKICPIQRRRSLHLL